MVTIAAQRQAFEQGSWELAEELRPKPGDTYELRSKSTGDKYEMLVIPEGYAVHMDFGCDGEPFNGPLGCWHSKTGRKVEMTTSQALVRAEAVLTPAPIAFNDAQVAVIKESIARGATDQELQLFLTTCARTGLDPFMRQIYAVKRWDSSQRKEVMAIQVGIDGQRLIADRTGKFAGMDPVEFLDVDGVWSEVWTGAGEHPIAARVRIYRKDFARPVPAAVRWDSYAQTYKKDNVTHLMPTWAAMPDVMLGKCCESLGLRRAFPAEMSALAAVAGYDPDADLSERMQDVADWAADQPRNVVEGEIVQRATPAPAAPAAAAPQRAAVNNLRLAYMDLVSKQTVAKGEDFMRWAVERFPYAAAAGNKPKLDLAKLSDEDAGFLLVEAKRYAKSGEARCADDGHEARYSEDTTLLECSICGLSLQEPETEPEPEEAGAAQASLLG